MTQEWQRPPCAGQRARGEAPRTAYDDLVASMLADRDDARLERHYVWVQANVDAFAGAEAMRRERYKAAHRRYQRRMRTA